MASRTLAEADGAALMPLVVPGVKFVDGVQNERKILLNQPKPHDGSRLIMQTLSTTFDNSLS
jgi:hypothetical protein